MSRKKHRNQTDGTRVSQDIDWQESDWLVTQLRARIGEENGGGRIRDLSPDESIAPSPQPAAEPPASEPPATAQERIELTEEAAQAAEEPTDEVVEDFAEAVEEPTDEVVEDFAEVAEEPADEVIEEFVEVAEGNLEVTEEAPQAPQEPVPEFEQLSLEIEEPVIATTEEPALPVESVAEETAALEEDAPEETVPEQTAPAEAQASVPEAQYTPAFNPVPPPQRRTSLFAASYEGETESSFAPPRAAEGTRRREHKDDDQRPMSRTVDELRAEATVEDLMLDLFGESEEAQASGQSDEAAALLESSVAPVPDEGPETITRDRDGQMALVLPETGRPLAVPSDHSEAPVRRAPAPTETAVDDDQIDLFTAQEGEEPILAPDPERERMDLKHSIEASEEEFRFLMDMDYEAELGEVIGFERIRTYHEEGVNGHPAPKRRRRTGEKREYEAQGQDTSLRKRYTKQKSEHLWRFALSVAFTVLIFIYERAAWMAALFGGPFDGEKYPVSYILIGIQLLLIVAYFSYQRLFEGFVRLLRFSPIDYSLCSISLLATFAYHALLILLPKQGAPALYLSPAALSISLLALADLLDWYRESLAFGVVSSRKQKYALIPRASVGGRQGDARASLEDADVGRVFYVRPVGFVRNYFANTEKRFEHNHVLGAQFFLMLAVSLSLGLYVLARGGSAVDVLQTAFVAFSLSLPVTSLLVTSTPMFFAAVLRLGKKGALVGETPLYESMEGNTVVIPDDEVFASMQHEHFEFFVESDDTPRQQILLRAFLEKVCSPLADAVRVTRERRMSPTALSLAEIAEHGACATLKEEGVTLMLGDADYIAARGIAFELPPDAIEEANGKTLLIFAVNGVAVAFFLARYRIKDDMLLLLDELQEQGIRLVVRSKDPAVCDALFEALLPERREPVRVMKPAVREMELRTDRVDATIVALGSCRDAVRTYLTGRRVRRMGAFGKLFQLFSLSTGVLVSLLFTLLTGAAEISAFFVSLFLFLWCAAHAAASYFYLRVRKK